MVESPCIEIVDLTKHYGSTVGLEDLTLRVDSGEVFGFLGPNGAGKTTTIRLLLDLIRPTRGEARLFGSSFRNPGIRRRVGYLPGELALDERSSGSQNLDYLQALIGGASSDRRRRLCARLGLGAKDLKRQVRDYSRGMKQKLGLIGAMQHDPDLLILDEPTTGLDPLVREELFRLLGEVRRAGKTVFHSSHVLSEVERTCTRVAIVRQGRLMDVRVIEEMRRDSARKMVVRFESTVPAEQLALPGVECVESEGNLLVLRVSGDLNPLIRALARHRILELSFPESGLEQAFSEYYVAGDENQ